MATTAASAKVLLGNIPDADASIEVLIAKSICDLEKEQAPVFPQPSGTSPNLIWALSNIQHAAVINVLKENYATVFKTSSISSGASKGLGVGAINVNTSQSQANSSASGGSRVSEVAAHEAEMLRRASENDWSQGFI